MDIILLKLSCTMKMKKLKKQNEGKFMSRKNSINTMKNKIKEMYATGHTQKEIASVFSVTQHHVSDIVRGKTWTHLTTRAG